jgi:hypothetical protein
MNNSMKNLLFLTIIAAIVFSSCGDDEPIIEQEKIFGTITIENVDTWQTWADSGEVQITLFPEFSLDPLAGWGDVPDNTFGPGVLGGTFAVGAPYNSQNPVILTFEAGKTEYDYEIEVEPGTYSALAIGFRHDFVNDPSLKTATLGVNWNNPGTVSHGVVIKIDVGGGNIVNIFDFPAPTDIVIAEGEQKEINFTADFNFVNSWYQ